MASRTKKSLLYAEIGTGAKASKVLEAVDDSFA